MMRTWSLVNLESMRSKTIPFRGDWEAAFGHPEKGGCWIIFGKAGSGKTSFALQLAKEFDELKFKVLYQSIEMGACKDFRDSLAENKISSSTHKITFNAGATIDELDEYLSKKQSPDVIFTDSIQYWHNQYGVSADDIIRLRQKHKNKIFIFISHIKNNEVEGSDAYETKRDSFIRIQVENFRALFIGRGKGGKKGYYTIWPEGAARHWLENDNNNSDDAENGYNEE